MRPGRQRSRARQAQASLVEELDELRLGALTAAGEGQDDQVQEDIDVAACRDGHNEVALDEPAAIIQVLLAEYSNSGAPKTPSNAVSPVRTVCSNPPNER
jgi:hypothetical protein